MGKNTGEIKANNVQIAKTVLELRNIAKSHSETTQVELTYDGKMSYMKSAKELRNLVENSRYLWYNASGAEAEIIHSSAETMTNADYQIAIAMGYGGKK